MKKLLVLVGVVWLVGWFLGVPMPDWHGGGVAAPVEKFRPVVDSDTGARFRVPVGTVDYRMSGGSRRYLGAVDGCSVEVTTTTLKYDPVAVLEERGDDVKFGGWNRVTVVQPTTTTGGAVRVRSARNASRFTEYVGVRVLPNGSTVTVAVFVWGTNSRLRDVFDQVMATPESPVV